MGNILNRIRGSYETKLRDRLVAHNNLITDRLDPDFGLLDVLLASRSLTRSEVSRIKAIPDSSGRSEKVLEYVSEKNICEQFLDALTDTQQTHLVNFILSNGERSSVFGDDWPLTEREISILDTNQRSFVDLLETCDLLHNIYSHKVINNRQRDYVSSKPTSHEKNDALLEILRRTSLQNYNKTIYCLNLSKQSHIATVLKDGGVVVRVHSELETEGNANDVEDELITIVSEMFGYRSMDDSDRILYSIRLRLIAAKKGNSIILYFFCKTSTDVFYFQKMQSSGKLADVVREMFNEMLSRELVITVRTTFCDEDFFKCELEKSCDKDDASAALKTTVISKPNSRKPATKALKVEETYVYNAGKRYEDYTLSLAADSETSGGLKIISNKHLKFGKTISEGRFAVIREGQLTQGNETITVATKGIRRGYLDADAILMADKIGYQSRIPSHVNVVKFLGQLEDANETGPMMVLEYCEMSLKNWLSEIENMNSDVLEDMSIITMNIANGVKHLHENQVVHRRLGARNVLLKQQYGGLVAKLIGFGPSREDKDGGQVHLPIKWLAPETLETLKSGSPTYNKNSDAWSFGVTVWEIYSKGEMPYSDLQSDKVKKLLTKDRRMVLTCPEICPIELFHDVIAPCWNFTANRRPSFAEICSKMDTFRNGTGQEPHGYYTAKSPYSGVYSDLAGIPLYDDAA